MPHTKILDPGTVIQALRDVRFAGGVRCPRCRATSIQRWGGFSGRQRYRCTTCRRTFSDFTATPAAYIKKLAAFATSAECLRAGMPVREASRVLDVSCDTAFRWRHRLCGALRDSPKTPLEGVIELATFQIPQSFKGQSVVHRQPRHHAAPHSLRFDGILVMVTLLRGRYMQSRYIQELSRRFAAVPTPAAFASLATTLSPRTALVVGRGSMASFSMICSRRGAPLIDARSMMPARNGAHVLNATTQIRRLGAWMKRFRGVATSYLSNYLAWHVWVDEQEVFPSEPLRWPMAMGDDGDRIIPVPRRSEWRRWTRSIIRNFRHEADLV